MNTTALLGAVRTSEPALLDTWTSIPETGPDAWLHARSERPPVLLTDATWYGTLAAARDLGERGVPVIAGYDTATAPLRWSRHVDTTLRCPSTTDADAFVDWLHEFGERNPGYVLYPTSDDVAFLIAYHRATLSQLYRLFMPPLNSLMSVLDKSSLAESCRRVGLATPETWAPCGPEDLASLAQELPYPVLIKPRAQLLSSGSTKGVRVDSPCDLERAWSKVRDDLDFDRRAIEVAPELGLPIIQALHACSERIYTIDGFVDGDGEIVGALACVKCLQIPRGAGPGVCFEAAELDPVTMSGLARLFRDVGFAGVFDVEFAFDGDSKLLIDVNPRFYNHMAFEIERGLPLPWYAYLAATGQRSTLRELGRSTRLSPPVGSGAYVHRLPMQLMLAAQRFSGNMTRRECREWRRWMRRHRSAGLHDPAFTRHDRLPGLLDLVHQARYPRSLVKKAARGK
jgi:D-aspartate ligase